MTTTIPSFNTGDWENAVTLFSGDLQLEFQHTDLIGTDKSQFSSRPEGETFNYDVMESRRGINQADGVELGYQIADITNNQLTVDDPIIDWVYVRRDQLQIRPDLRLPQKQAQTLGRGISNAKMLRCLGLLCEAADTAGNTHEIDVVTETANDTLGPAVRDIMEEIGAEMDTDAVPNTPRWAFLKSNIWYPLNGVTGVKSVDFGGQADNPNAGGIGRMTEYANFMMVNSAHGFGTDTTASPYDAEMPTKYRYDMSNVLGVVWHPDSWALRHVMDIEVDINYVPRRQAFLTVAKLIMGAVKIDPLSIGVHIITDGSSGA